MNSRNSTAALLAALAFLGCSSRSSDARVAAAERHRGTDSESTPGSGHLHLTGEVTSDVDFAIDGCQIGEPGEGLLNGYRMAAKDGDSTIMLLSVVLHNYAKDGSYTADTSSVAQLKEAIATGAFSPLTLMIRNPASPEPLAFGVTPTSVLTLTISDNGSTGKADILNEESQVSSLDMVANTNEKPRGKRVSGSVTWSCGHVDRLNAEMSKAVDGMMNKLMPNH
jgi:hypothetical protein